MLEKAVKLLDYLPPFVLLSVPDMVCVCVCQSIYE